MRVNSTLPEAEQLLNLQKFRASGVERHRCLLAEWRIGKLTQQRWHRLRSRGPE